MGAEFETEALWLRAQALEKLGKGEDARKELVRLAGMGVNDAFTTKAREKLGQAEKK